MSNHKSYGKQRSNSGRPPSPYSALAVCDRQVQAEDPYERLTELAEGLMRKYPEMSEDYAMWKASEMCAKREVI